MKRIKSKKKASMMIGIIFEFAIVMALIFCFVSLWKPFLYKQNLDYMAKEMVRTVETEGRINSTVYNLQNQMEHELGINPDVTWSASYISGTDKIQIRSRFKLTLRDAVKIKLFEPTFGNPITIDIPIKKEFTGVSQVFWK